MWDILPLKGHGPGVVIHTYLSSWWGKVAGLVFVYSVMREGPSNQVTVEERPEGSQPHENLERERSKQRAAGGAGTPCTSGQLCSAGCVYPIARDRLWAKRGGSLGWEDIGGFQTVHSCLKPKWAKGIWGRIPTEFATFARSWNGCSALGPAGEGIGQELSVERALLGVEVVGWFKQKSCSMITFKDKSRLYFE